MAKITLTDLAVASTASLISSTNINNTLIEAAIENTLSRDGASPNSMDASLDMNSHRIINLPDASTDQEPVTLAQVSNLVAEAAIDTNIDFLSSPFIRKVVLPLNYDGTGWEFTLADGTVKNRTALTLKSDGHVLSASDAFTAGGVDAAVFGSLDAAGTAGKAALHVQNEAMSAAGIVGVVIYKTTTGDPADVQEGLFCINTTDNTFKVYSDGGWRTLASGW